MVKNVSYKLWGFLLFVSACGFVAYLKSEQYIELYVQKHEDMDTCTLSAYPPMLETIEKTENVETTNENHSPIILLEWYKAFGRVIDDYILRGCGGCLYTQNRSKLMEKNTKAVVMHFAELKKSTMPKERRPDQYYVWYTMESSLTLYNKDNLHLDSFDGVFNLTMTYRRDSDVYAAYATAHLAYLQANGGPRPKTELQMDELIKQKTHVALWAASNCATNKGAIERLKYAKQMIRDGLDLTFGGKCSGDMERKQFNYTKYKFYLAFENSWDCKDYITEKFWKNSLFAGTVPVVIGPPKADYEAVAPPNSFIFAQDFATPKKLVEYLQFLDKNDNAYKQYLVWTTLDASQMPWYKKGSKQCHLCQVMTKLTSKTTDSPVFSSLSRTNFSVSKWFFGTDNPKCFS